MERERVQIVIKFVLAIAVVIAGVFAYITLPVVQSQLSGAGNALRAADVKGIRIFIRTASSFPLITGLLLGIFKSLVPTLPDGEYIRAISGVFGPLPGFLISWASLTLGATATYLVMRGLFASWLEPIISRRASGIKDFFSRRGPLVVMAARLLPFIPGDVVAYLSGMAPIRLTGYLWATALALVPRILLFSLAAEDVPPNAFLLYQLLATAASIALFVMLTRSSDKTNAEQQKGDVSNRGRAAKLAIGGGFVLAAVVVYMQAPGARSLVDQMVALGSKISPTDVEGGISSLRSFLLGFGIWAPLVSGALMILHTIVIPFPGEFITFTNGALFGIFWGAVLSWTSSMIGAAICFMIGKTFGRPLVEKLIGSKTLSMLDRFFERYGTRSILVARLIPVVPFVPVSYAAGLTPMSLGSFLIATGIGQLPATIVFSWIGRNLAGPIKVVFLAFVMIIAISLVLSAIKPRFERSIMEGDTEHGTA